MLSDPQETATAIQPVQSLILETADYSNTEARRIMHDAFDVCRLALVEILGNIDKTLPTLEDVV